MENSLHLSRVELSGYKSIKNVDISFEPGLNIIIGKNAVGKTNFLSFLHKCLEFQFRELGSFDSTLYFKNKTVATLKLSRDFKRVFDKREIEEPSPVKQRPKYKTYNREFTNKRELTSLGISYYARIISHGVPSTFPIIETPLNFIIDAVDSVEELHLLYEKYNSSNLLGNLLIDLLIKISEIKNDKSLTETEYKRDRIHNDILEVFRNNLEPFNEALKMYTPIEEVRLNSSFFTFLINDSKEFIVHNLLLEFKIFNNWIPYSNLSDGTKRLFYIITECFGEEETLIFKSENVGTFSKSNEIILLEEPELGIHPHQYMLLLDFLKEQSRNKQIIITTHSPQTIDILEADELNKIILAYTQDDGSTGLRHLGENEISKAQAYLEKSYLSDYWLYSDLEK